MINIFISAMIAIFFLGKFSKEVNEKTNQASWFRTLVYLFLTIIFSILYYRTFQVATIINTVEISSLRGVEDSLLHSKDTIESISINNNFKTLGSYKNPYFDYLKSRTSLSDDGGVSIALKDSVSSTDFVKDRKGFTDEIKKEIEALIGKTINSNTGSIYNFSFFSSSIPSLIPVYPIIRYDKPKVENKSLYSKIEKVGNVVNSVDGKVMISKSDPAKGYFIDALSYQQTIVAHYPDFHLHSLGMPHPLANTIDIFTAADLSQYTYCIELNSDMYINHLSVSYNVPIEISNQPEGLILSANGFDINDDNLLNNIIKNQPMMFLVKLPTMANLQQIRSLVLTAIVTALFSLFCTNLFYRIRKHATKYKAKHHLSFSERRNISRKRVKDFKIFLYTITFIFLIVFLIVVFFAAFGYTFLINYENLGWKIALNVICIIVILIVVIYFLYKYAITPVQKKKDEKIKEKL
jgi:hypothetical protein